MPAQDVSGDNQMESPARNAEAVTPHDTNELTKISRALYIGTGGDVTVQMAGTGTAILFANVPSGAILPIRVIRVNDTGTDAEDIVALY